jgi:hypothetical protein
VHLTPAVILDLTGSLLETHAPGSVLRSPLVAIGLRYQISNVPDFLNHFQQHGWIKGRVSADEDGQVGDGIAGVTVVLDGVERTRTNNSGFYYFHSVPEGKHSVEIEYQSSSAYLFTSAPHVETSENTIINFGISIRKAVLFGTVRNDAGVPIGKAMVRLEGATPEQMHTTEGGLYRFNLKDEGAYTVTIDAQSLPPGYDLASARPQTVKVEVNDPGRADFVVRALRSVYGTVSCAGAPLDNHQAALHLDKAQSSIAVDQNGKYKVSDVSSGWHELAVTYGGVHLTRRIELPAEPASLEVDLEVCAGDAAARLRSTPAIH